MERTLENVKSLKELAVNQVKTFTVNVNKKHGFSCNCDTCNEFYSMLCGVCYLNNTLRAVKKEEKRMELLKMNSKSELITSVNEIAKVLTPAQYIKELEFGESASSYAKRKGFKLSTFNNWVRKYRSEINELKKEVDNKNNNDSKDAQEPIVNETKTNKANDDLLKKVTELEKLIQAQKEHIESQSRTIEEMQYTIKQINTTSLLDEDTVSILMDHEKGKLVSTVELFSSSEMAEDLIRVKDSIDKLEKILKIRDGFAKSE